MTQNQRENVVRSFVDQFADRASKSKSAIQAMQEALDLSEAGRRKLSESFRESKVRLHNALAEQQRLEDENHRLANQVTTLTGELQQSREQADKLLDQVREENQKEWLKRETMFKNTIRKLQKQIRAEKAKEGNNTPSGGTIVPDGSSECRTVAPVTPQVRVGNTIIRPVSRGELSDRHRAFPSNHREASERLENDENKGCEPPPPPRPVIAEGGILKNKKVLGSSNFTLNGQAADKKVKTVIRSNAKKESGIQAPSGVCVSKSYSARPTDAFKGTKTPSKSRTEFVRGNGGLRGLQEKLRQVRSPKFL